MFFFRVILLLRFFILIVKSEWIKISESPESHRAVSDLSDKSSFLQSNIFGNILDKNQINLNEAKITKPSQEWENYQRQRFETAIKAQEIKVTGSDNLKTAAKVLVPVPKNQSVQFDIFNKSLNSNIKTPVKIKSKTLKEAPKKETSFQGFLKFLKSVQSSLISKTSQTVKEKIQKLSNFRDALLLDIEERIQNLWPSSRKSKRSIEKEVEFPTAETALMTISFLTFAVFLIKLVLQVIHTIKSKHYKLNNLDAVNFAKRTNARSFGNSQLDIEMTENILKSIQNYKEKN